MFSQSQPSEETQSINQNHSHRRRKKKSIITKIKSKKDNKRRQTRFAFTMSSWAENFTAAATWNLKHQIAYWKSRAMALEYENRLLHDIIKKKCIIDDIVPIESLNSGLSEHSGTEDNVELDESDSVGDDDENFEVSEEFIQFLMENAKYKQDARQERERIKALEEDQRIRGGIGERSNVKENPEDVNKALYGKNWQRISALETALQSKFISSSDSVKPEYWPNIPFNFNFI